MKSMKEKNSPRILGNTWLPIGCNNLRTWLIDRGYNGNLIRWLSGICTKSHALEVTVSNQPQLVGGETFVTSQLDVFSHPSFNSPKRDASQFHFIKTKCRFCQDSRSQFVRFPAEFCLRTLEGLLLRLDEQFGVRRTLECEVHCWVNPFGLSRMEQWVKKDVAESGRILFRQSKDSFPSMCEWEWHESFFFFLLGMTAE
jgi:hypothetical protein